MSQDSNVYGYIQFDKRCHEAMRSNLQCVNSLPEAPEDRLLWRGMFNMSVRPDTSSGLIHFAACYDGIEYEWEYWISQFQRMLQSMSWDSATVHLETLFSGSHTFNWENEDDVNASLGQHQVRCQWTRESSFQ